MYVCMYVCMYPHQVIKIGRERFEAAECLFNPALVDSEKVGMADMVFEMIQVRVFVTLYICCAIMFYFIEHYFMYCTYVRYYGQGVVVLVQLYVCMYVSELN